MLVRLLALSLGVVAATAAVVATQACTPRLPACAVACGGAGADECPGGTTCQAGLCVAPGDVCGPGDGDAGPDGRDAGPPATGHTALSVGWYHACAIDAEGDLWCWGNNDYRQLGTASVRQSGTPLRITVAGGPASGWDAVSAGYRHTCAIHDGELYCWGLNDDVQCGVDSGGNFVAPTRVEDAGVSGAAWTAVATGSFYTCGLRDDGSLWCWGQDDAGQLGQGAFDVRSSTPLRVGLDADWRRIDSGPYHLCGVRGAPGTRGRLFCWGYAGGGDGRLGDGGGTSNRNVPNEIGAPTIDWTQVDVGDYSACARDLAGAFYCWGNEYHLPGMGLALVPTRFDMTQSYDLVSVGSSGGCNLRAGEVRCWGLNDKGQLGRAPGGGSYTPVVVPGIADAVAVGRGYETACALHGAGVVSCWGSNSDGQLGDGQVADARAPVEIGAAQAPWRGVALGTQHTCAVTEAGVMWCWGWNDAGQVGAGPLGPIQTTPVRVTGTESWDRVAAGETHTCGLTPAGALFCWGQGSSGELGTGSFDAEDMPTPVEMGTSYAEVATGRFHTCGVRTAGRERACWGSNAHANLGNGATGGAVNLPQAVAGPAGGWAALSLGGFFGCGIHLTTPSTLACWGENDAGQLGSGNLATATQLAPLAAANPAGSGPWLGVDVGGYHACGLWQAGTDEKLYCWGANDYQQAGDTVTDARATPTLVPGALDWVQVSAAERHTCARRAGGELHCFGRGDRGALGDGEASSRAAIGATVAGMSDWAFVATGGDRTCAVRGAQNRLFCWGDGDFGGVGQGASLRFVPHPVSHP